MSVHYSEFLGTSRQRDSLFTVVVGAIFITGFVLNEFSQGRDTGRTFGVGVLLLFLTLILTMVQAYANGSTVLALLLSVALPLGFVIEPILFEWHSGLYTMLHLGLAVGMLFGVTGHLIGSQLTTVRETQSDPSYRGQIALTVLTVVVIALYLV